MTDKFSLSFAVTAKSTAGGAISFTWPPVTHGQNWQVGIVIPTAPTAATGTMKVDGQSFGPILGNQPGPSVEVPGGSHLSFTGTGFTATTTYKALAVGSWYTGPAEGLVPAGPSTLVTITNATIPVSGSVTVTSGTVAISSGSVTVTTGTIDVLAPTGVPVINLASGALTTADACDPLYHGVYTTTTTATTNITVYGLATTTGTFEKLTTVAPGTSVNARGFRPPKKITKKWLRLALSSPSAIYTTSFTTEPGFPTTGALRKIYAGHWATTLSGKSLAAGSYSAKVYLVFGTPTPAHGPIVFSTLVMRVWIWNGTTATLVGSLTATTVSVTASATGHTTATLSGTLPASSTLGAATRVVIDLVGRASAPTQGGTTPTDTLRVGHGTTRLKVSLAYKGTSGKATWNLGIAGSLIKKSYSAVAVVVRTLTAKIPRCVAVWDGSLKLFYTFVPTFVSAFQRLANASTCFLAILPMANRPTDNISLKVLWTGGTKGTITVYGFTANPSLNMRNDGRAFPLGVLGASSTGHATGSTTIITAVATLRILLKTVVLSGYAAAAETTPLYVKGTIGGTVRTLGNLFQTPTAASVSLDIPDEGLLLDVDTALTISNPAATKYWACSVVYDLVL